MANELPPSLTIRQPTAQTNASGGVGTAAGGATGSTLTDRVTTESPRGPRFPLLLRLFGPLIRCFRPTAAESPRLRAQRQAASLSQQGAENELAESIKRFCATITSTAVQPGAIRDALLEAERAANALKLVNNREKAEQKPEPLSNTAVRHLRHQFGVEHLTRIAKALAAPEVAQVQKQLGAQPGAEQVLMQIDAAINELLILSLETPIFGAILRAHEGIEAKAPSEEIADRFHQAFDSAVPLVQQGALNLTRQGQLHVDLMVMRALDQKPYTQQAILRHVRPEDLDRLDARAKEFNLPNVMRHGTGATSKTVETLRSEIDSRSLFAMLTELRLAALQLTSEPSPAASQTFQGRLTATAAALEALEQHSNSHGLLQPREHHSFVELQSQLRSAVTPVFDSDGLDPSSLSGDELLRLSGALRTLGIRDCGGVKLYAAERAYTSGQRSHSPQSPKVTQTSSGDESAPYTISE